MSSLFWIGVCQLLPAQELVVVLVFVVALMLMLLMLRMLWLLVKLDRRIQVFNFLWEMCVEF